jgi:hypothetical protein
MLNTLIFSHFLTHLRSDLSAVSSETKKNMGRKEHQNTPPFMKNSNTPNQSTMITSLRSWFILAMLALITQQISAQCTGCTSTVSSNTAVTVNSGSVVCLTFAGTYNKTITFNGGTLCIGPSTTVTSAITIPTGGSVNVYGSYTGSMTQNAGSIIVYSGGTYSPAGFNLNGGSLTINSGGSSTLGTPTFPNGYTFTNNGALSIAGFTLNSGATVTLSGTSQTISSGVTNNGTLSITGPTTISGSFTQNGSSTSNFTGGVTVTGSLANNGTINVSGTLSVGGSYASNSSATIKATNAAMCNAVTVGGSISGTGTFDGNGNEMTISPTPSCCMSNGATAVPTTPTQQATTFSASLSGVTVSGSFTAPSASIASYIVLRYIGTVAPSCSPSNNTVYTVGSSIGTCTVAAIVTGGSTGTKTFTDNITPATTNCGKNIYYRVFSYNGSGDCVQFYTTSPLTGSVSIPAFTASVTAGSATTFCAGGSVTLTATAGASYAWSNAATTQAITATTSATYTVTVTTAAGCTASASKIVSVTALPAANISGTTSICSGRSTTLTASGGGTYLWSTGATTTSISVNTAAAYVVTVTASGCTDTAIRSVTVNALPTPSVTSDTICTGGTATLTAAGGSSYFWSTAATTSSISTSSAGTYRVTVTNASSCTASVSGTVTVNSNPTAAVAVTSGCAGSMSTLTASGGTSYLWSTGATTAAITSSTATAYTVTVTNASGCTASATGTAIIYSNPTVSTSGAATVCVGSSFTISATPSGSASYTYSWSGPSSYTATTSSFTINNAIVVNGGSYALTVTDNHSCQVTAAVAITMDATCTDSTTVGANGGNSSDAPCTQILRFDHYNDVVAGSGGQNHTWILNNGNRLTMTITRTAGSLTAVTAPTWSGAAFGQSGYTGLRGKTVLYTTGGGWSKVAFTNIQMKDSLGNAINNFTLIGIDAESTDNSERDTLVSNGTSWFDYDTITPPSIGSVPLETGIGTSTLVWTGTGGANARARLVSTNNPTSFTFSTVAGGLQGFAMGVANPIQAPSAVTICSNSAFNATPTNLPAGTTYTWTAPIISPAGSITGATAQSTALASVSQTLVNTTSANATATYTVIPSNNCSGLGYTFTVTVKPAPSATTSTSGAACIGGNITVTATPVAGAPLTYSWSGPSSFTSTASTYTITSGTLANSGNYSVTITGSNACTATTSAAVSFVNCLTASGTVFDDANGNGIAAATDTISSYSQTLYAIVADTNGLVIGTGTVAANGAFSVSGLLPSTPGMNLRISTTNPSLGSAVPAASWPTNWLGTLGQYGVNNLAGTGVYNNVNEIVPIKTGTLNITGMLIGFDRLAPPVNQAYTITRPAQNSVKALTLAAGLGNVTWKDPEDGLDVGTFEVTSVTLMRGNTLFYDSNTNNIVDAREAITGYRAIANFNAAKLKVKFTGTASTNLQFSFDYIDAANKTNPTSSTYKISWTVGALPVKLEYFTAEKKDEHSALLKWTTASEINNDHFEIERSDNATEWFKIGQVQGAGNSNENIDYSLVDEEPLAGPNYYRLKQIDYDGHFAYSEIAEVEFGAGQKSTAVMTIYPNPLPAGKPLNIALAGTSDAIKHIMITNDLGQPVYQKDPTDEQGYRITGLTLPTGTYIINVVSQSNETFTSKIVIQ